MKRKSFQNEKSALLDIDPALLTYLVEAVTTIHPCEAISFLLHYF